MHKEVCNTIMLVKVMRDVRRWQSLVSLSQQQFVTRLPAATPAAQVLLYTVDGASLLPVAMGSLPGGDVLATVDFGPTTDVEAAFALQKRWAGHGAVCSLLGMCVLLGGCVQPNSFGGMGVLFKRMSGASFDNRHGLWAAYTQFADVSFATRSMCVHHSKDSYQH